jgi:NAD(P)-dependent dehydrogenase (short-subunit alcohol dehydrogenase family)
LEDDFPSYDQVIKLCLTTVTLAETNESTFDEVMAVDLKGVFLCMKHEIQQMLQNGGGAIVNNASIDGMIAESGISAYVAAKHGVIGLTKTAAMEYAAHGIRINALAPGLVETAMTKAWFDDPNIRRYFLAKTPLGRVAQPEEMAGMVCFFVPTSRLSPLARRLSSTGATPFTEMWP